MVEVKNVTKRYEGKRTVHALRGVSLRIEKGEMVATMGPSGSGKSTLLNIIGGLDRPSDGSIFIDGVEIERLDDDSLTRLRREKIGFVFQFFNLLPTLNAQRERGPSAASGARCPAGRPHARSVALLELVGLEDRQEHLPDELSGGEQQRVAMARALVLRPPLILADEPTGNLDSKNGEEVLSLFKQTAVAVQHHRHDGHPRLQGRHLLRPDPSDARRTDDLTDPPAFAPRRVPEGRAGPAETTRARIRDSSDATDQYSGNAPALAAQFPHTPRNRPGSSGLLCHPLGQLLARRRRCATPSIRSRARLCCR